MSKECKIRLKRDKADRDAHPGGVVRFGEIGKAVLYVSADRVGAAQEIDVTITTAETLREEQIRRICELRSRAEVPWPAEPHLPCFFPQMLAWALHQADKIATERAARDK